MSKTRDERILDWVREGTSDVEKWDDEVWWGFWSQVGKEMADPPNILFPSKVEAQAWATLMEDNLTEYHIGPVVLTMEIRDSLDVPPD